MPSQRASSEQRSSLLITMIIFMVLFLAAAVFAVVMYLQGDDLRKSAAVAEERIAEMATPAQYNVAKRLVEKRGNGIITAMGRIEADMRSLAQIITGEDMGNVDLAAIRITAEKRVDGLWDMVMAALNDTHPELTEKKHGLVAICQALLDDRNAFALRFSQAITENLTQKNTYDQRIAALQTENQQLGDQLAGLGKAAKTYDDNYKNQLKTQEGKYEQYINQLNNQITDMQAREKQMREESDNIKKQLTSFRDEVKNLKNRLAKFQPSPETETAALENDGIVVSVVPRDKLAYINLGKNDHIYRGLTFEVYDRYEPIPKNGRGKGSLEVIEIMDTISKCRITSFDQTNPIMDKDVIANVVWSRDKKYLFCVAGEFDYQGSDRMNIRGRELIIKMIENWGGRVTDTLTVDTDFLILGSPPALAPRPREQEMDSNSETASHYRKSQEQLNAYNQIRQEGATLDVPTFNLSRFLAFIGQNENAHIALNP